MADRTTYSFLTEMKMNLQRGGSRNITKNGYSLRKENAGTSTGVFDKYIYFNNL